MNGAVDCVASSRVPAEAPANADREATHGRALSERQEARRIARPLTLVDGVRPARMLEVGTAHLMLVTAP